MGFYELLKDSLLEGRPLVLPDFARTIIVGFNVSIGSHLSLLRFHSHANPHDSLKT